MKDLKNNTLATFPQIRITKTPGKAQTGKNVIQDGKPMYKRKDGKVVKRGLWSNTYLSKKQEGGMNEQQPDLMSLFSWFAENVPDDDFNSPEDVIKEFQQLSPEQQQQFVASIQQQMGTMQYGGMSINASPTKKSISQLGYSDDSPYKDYEMLPIDSNYLTMEKTGIPLMAVGNQSGERQYMSPYSGDYYFPNDEDVTEYPLAQTGNITPSYSGNSIPKSKTKKKNSIPIDYDHLYYTDNWKYDNLDYSSFNQKAPLEFTDQDFPTPPLELLQPKGNFFSNVNLSDAWKKKQSDTQNEISILDPKLIQRNEQGNIPLSDGDWSKVIDLSKSNPFEYAPMLQNYTNALYQDPQYRATANIKGAFTPEIDVRGAIQAIDDELKDSIRNVDMNSTAGAAIAAQLQANASKNKLNIINDAAQKNAQIRGQNSQSEANRQNQQTQLQQQYDAQYYDNILRSRSASQQEKNRALTALLSRKEQKDAMETNIAVATMPYGNFKYKPGEGVFRNNKVEFQAPQVEPRKIEEETTKKKKQMGGWGSKFKFKNV